MRSLGGLFVLFCMLGTGVFAHAGEVIDRIIAIVNKNPIFLSDWDEALRCEALLAGRTPESYNDEERRAAFDRLVDQELVREQMSSYLLPAILKDDIDSRLQQVRKQLAGGDVTKWKALLAQAGVSEEEVAERLRTQAEIERFVDVRFRSGIRIDDRSVNRYYRDQFLPELQKSGAPDVPLEKVAGKIREILTQQQMDEQMSAWLQTLREQTEIRIVSDAKPDAPVLPETKTESKSK